MSRTTKFSVFSLVAIFLAQGLGKSANVYAQNGENVPAAKEGQADSWYYGPTTPTVEKRSISQRKSQMRAQQRMARLEALRRHGLTPNRPPAVAIPFTSVHTLSWMRSGRSPFITYRSDRPIVYYSYPYTIYR